MTLSSREGAARYFFETFLGCSIPVDGALLTKAFFENTRDFIKGMPVTPEKKSDLLTSLTGSRRKIALRLIEGE